MSLEPAETGEIVQLVTRADDCATARDAEAYAALFTENAVMDGAMGRAVGHDELAATVAAVWAREPPGTLHLTLNPVVEATEPEPTVTSVMLVVAAGSPGTIVGSARVTQKVRKTHAGWRISERQIAEITASGGTQS
jgi:ketosteroid isomerase-like protein